MTTKFTFESSIYELRQMLTQTSNTCKLCGQEDQSGLPLIEEIGCKELKTGVICKKCQVLMTVENAVRGN